MAFALWMPLFAGGCPTGEPDAWPRGLWHMLHGNDTRTVAADTWGIEEGWRVQFDHQAPDEKSAFSGPILGVADPEVFGVDHLIYRVQGPGPMSLNPPPGIDFFLGDL
ncbi:MAG: hypothetical protein JRI25_10865, partial [Deltaproteobacteria bacterium]|nr:hypothetical protein [Deltaproteobacteria bacterium]